MKRLIYIIALSGILIYSSGVYAQTGWMLQQCGTIENLNYIQYISPQSAFAVGNLGKVYYTENSGQNWTLKAFPVSTNNLCGFFSGVTGYVGNQNSKIYKTTNKGNSWTEYSIGANYQVSSIYFSSDNVGWAGDFLGHVLKTTNGGENWSVMVTTPGYGTKVFFFTDNIGWAVDNYGYVYRTTNSGLNFSSQKIISDTLSAVKFISSTLGYVVGDSGKVFKSTNGGASWALLNTGVTDKLFGVTFGNSPEKIYVSGEHGLILESTNGGINWINQRITSNNLQWVNFYEGTSYGYICGDGGTILRTLSSPTSVYVGNDTLKASYPFTTYWMDAKTQMLYSAQELINSGALSSGGNITSISFNVSSFSTQVMNDLKISMQNYATNYISNFEPNGFTTVFNSNYTISAAGWQKIYLQIPFYWDGGSNLLVEICFNNSSYTTNTLVNATNAANSLIHKYQDLTTSGGCDFTTGNLYNPRPNIGLTFDYPTGIGDPVVTTPKNFSLYQNYPNPFNPSTKIRYDIPKAERVTIKIYDLLGKEVSTLVNENKSAGSYVVEFNASGLTSGIYFYRIFAGSYTDTKKMILVK